MNDEIVALQEPKAKIGSLQRSRLSLQKALKDQA